MENNEEILPFSEVTKFHGHVCPGSALGYRVAKTAMIKLNVSKSGDEELVAFCENDSCAVDAIQVVTGCTFGKGNFIFKDYGKHVYTFYNRENGENIRIYVNADFNDIVPEFVALKNKFDQGTVTMEDKKSFQHFKDELSYKILEVPEDKLFTLSKAELSLPKEANLYNSIKCGECGELVSEHRMKEKDGEKVCIPCFNKE